MHVNVEAYFFEVLANFPMFYHPEEHWVHIRTTNVVESPFSSVIQFIDGIAVQKKGLSKE